MPGYRIGELATRVGVTTHVLRAWERRYGLFDPKRSDAAYRLYSADDERQARAMVLLREAGVPAARAAAQVLAMSAALAPPPASSPPPVTAADHARDEEHVARLHLAVAAFDHEAAGATLDAALADLGLSDWISHVVMLFLRQLGDRWAAGTATIAHEHFASQLIRARLAQHTAAWGAGAGPTAVLACPPGERHDLGLFAFGVLLGRRGWRVRYFGPDTPVSALAAVCRSVQPEVVVLAATRPAVVATHATSIQRLARRHRVAVGGAGATPEAVVAAGAIPLPRDLVAAVGAVAAMWHDGA